MFKLETSCRRTWIEEACRSLRIAHSLSVRGSRTIDFGNTRNYKMPIWGYKANGRWFRAYKDRAKCRLESRTDWRTVETAGAFAEVLWTFPHVHPAVFLLPKYVPHRIEFSVPFEKRRRFGPREVRNLKCLTHLCLVSVFRDYSILSGSPFVLLP